ncbi:MAG: acyl-CoA thioesterase [Desulfatitalea sp.]|nr:acyl-CoA thioesterase [Desulfatitalea sp.]NNK00402.1 acyl-CoA thioesterase [Desulfatitalea sp.]
MNLQTHCTSYRVIYGDTDTMGVAYHANYLRWFEIGRTELLRAWGLPYREIESRDILLPVSEAHCKYMTPAKYDDVLIIEATLDDQIKAGLKIDYRIISEDGQKVHAEGYTRHAFLNREGKVIRPPKFMRELIRQQCDRS